MSLALAHPGVIPARTHSNFSGQHKGLSVHLAQKPTSMTRLYRLMIPLAQKPGKNHGPLSCGIYDQVCQQQLKCHNNKPMQMVWRYVPEAFLHATVSEEHFFD